jgi:hypothetical protein
VIRNVQDVSKLLDQRFGAAAGRPLSIVRVLAWMLVGLYLIGVLVPAPAVHLGSTHFNKALRQTEVRDLVLDKNDPRGWKHLKPDPSKFTVAWIGGSTLQTVRPHHYGFVAVDTLRQLPRIDGKPVRINMYLLESSRIYDLFAATADALSTKPDLIIVDLIPVWIFNPNAIQSWPTLNPATWTELVKSPSNWPLLAALNSPSDVALSLAASHLSSIRDRWSYAQKLHSLIDKLTPAEQKKINPNAKAPKLHGAQLIATMQNSYAFWNYYRLIPPGTPGKQRYEMFMRQAKTDGSVINDYIIGRMFGMLADSKIPAIAYLGAIDPSYLPDPGVAPTLLRIEKHLKALADQHKSPNLYVQPRSAIRFVSGLKFRDMVHMTYDPPFVRYMTSMICGHLRAIDPTSECTPQPTKATTR